MPIKISQLSNGLRVVTDDMPYVETLSLGVWVDAGSRHEAPELNGISHMLEHMAFKGTARRTALQIASEIEDVGGYINAYTSREQTAYSARVLAEDLELSVDIIADILQNSTFTAEELERERGVIVQEIGESLDTPDDIIFDHLQAAAYPSQALGRPILGTTDLVRSFQQQDLTAYMADQYHGPEMILAAAGKVDHDRVVDLAEQYFQTLNPSKARTMEAGTFTGGEVREHRDLEQLHLSLAFEGVTYSDEMFYASQVLSTALGGSMSSRLFQEIREKRGLAYTVHSYASSYEDTGLFGIYAATSPKDAPDLIPVIMGEVQKATHDFTEEEIMRSRAQLKAGMMMALESSSTRCEHMGRHLLIFGEVLSSEEIAAKVDAVDLEAVHKAAQHIFSGRTKPALAAVGPHKGLESYDDFTARLG